MKAAHTALVAKLVVVIDDNPLVLEATGGLLRSWGCCAVAAESCDEALVRLAQSEAGRRPDLIVCDYQLSGGLTGVGRHRRAPQRVLRCVRNSSAPRQRRCERSSVRGRLQGISTFVQAGECGEISLGAGRLRAAT
jgi:CheY-like chemotaxis protein